MAEDGANEYLTTRELAALLRIKERKVYELAASGDVPCSRATGKLLFPRHAIEAWIARNSSGPGVEPRPPRSNVVLGSHDPLLEWALRESRCGLATYLDGSADGLSRFAAGEGIAAGLHLCSHDIAQWNEHAVTDELGGQPVVLVEFAWRERGLIVAPDNAKAIRRVRDLIGRRLVPRQPGAGSQLLLERMLARDGLDDASISLISPARSEQDAALAVLDDKADAAFGLPALARQHGLAFVHVCRERFDLLIDRRAYFEPPLQQLLRFIASDALRAKADELTGYDVSGLGRVHFNGP